MLTLYEWPLSAKVSILDLAVLISKMFFGFRVGTQAIMRPSREVTQVLTR